METDRRWGGVISDLLINLAAGWFGAVVIVPVFVGGQNLDWWLLLFDITAGILSLKMAVILREGN